MRVSTYHQRGLGCRPHTQGTAKRNASQQPVALGQANLGVGDGTGGFTFHAVLMSPGYDLADIGDLNGDGKYGT